MLLVLLALGLALGGDAVRLALRYEREALAALQEPWRLLGAHLVHMNPAHLLLDGTTLVLLGALFVGRLPQRVWTASFLGAAAVIDVGLYVAHPAIAWYVGLSGVLHGQFAAGALWLALAGAREAWWLLAGLCAKLAWEWTVGPMPWSEAASRGPVVEVAHGYGAAGGLLGLVLVLALSERCRDYLRRQRVRA